jgi:hypothetical protein
MSEEKGALLCGVTNEGTVIEVGGAERCVVVDLGGDLAVAVCDVDVEQLRRIASEFMFKPVKVTIQIHEPLQKSLEFGE